jgi:dTDP-4-dehydrorhamnose 3,5-epimerase-like enzyme
LQKIETDLQGVYEIRPKVHRDARGFFLETYHQSVFAELGSATPLCKITTPIL